MPFSCRSLVWFFCLSAPAWALDFNSKVGPELPFYDDPHFIKCVDVVSRDPQEEDNSYALRCDVPTFIENIRKIRSPDPGFRYLVGKILLKELIDLKAQLLLAQPVKDIPDDSGQTAVNVGPPETAPALFRSRAELWYQELSYWIAPLMDKKRPESILQNEAVFTELQFLGEAMMFPDLSKKLIENQALLENARFRTKILRMVVDWAKSDPETLNPWLLVQLKKFRSSEIKGKSDEEFFLWTRSLELDPDSYEKSQREIVQKRLRSLWILFPDSDAQKKILELADRLSVKRTSISPSIKQMNIDELMDRSKAELSLVKGDNALQTIQTVLKLPKETYSQDELWEAFELHVRILRILDQRHMIPNVIDRYIRIGHFIDIPKDKTKMPDFFDHLYRIARLQWSYDSQKEALKTLDRILTLNLRAGTDYSLDGAYYIRARIMEQQSDKRIARDYFEESIEVIKKTSKRNSDLLQDLMWRNFFVNYDIAIETKDFTKLISLSEELRPYVNWGEEKSRWYYWSGKVYELNGQKDEAIARYTTSYDDDILGFYGIVSALALRSLESKVRQWKLDSGTKFWEKPKEWKAADWSDYFDPKTGKLNDKQWAPLARLYYLGRTGSFSLINSDLVNLEKVAYALAGKPGISTSHRRDYLRDIAWIRLAVGDRIGSIRMAELMRSTFKDDLDGEELAFLYPLPFSSIITEAAGNANINPWFAKSLIRQESAFNPRARSSANALGLMQMIPPVAASEAKKLKVEPFEINDLYRPEIAVKLGTKHLGDLYHDFGNSWICATAGYNAGRSPVYMWIDAYSNPNPVVFIERISFVETRKYVRSILRNFVNYQRIYGDSEINVSELTKMPERMPGIPVRPATAESQNALLN
jgi:tetratricopeptide (TPR) repeat protein